MSSNCLVFDQGAEYGNTETRAAITVRESGEIIVSGCQIINPKFRVIQIDRSITVRLTDCIVNEDERSQGMLTGIELNGVCSGTIIRDNSIGHGKTGDIANHATGVIVEANIPVGSVSKPNSSTSVKIKKP